MKECYCLIVLFKGIIGLRSLKISDKGRRGKAMDTLVTWVWISDICWILAVIVFWHVILKDKHLGHAFWGSIIIGILAYVGSIVFRITMGSYLSKRICMTIDIATMAFLILLLILVLFPEWDLNKRQEELLLRVMSVLFVSSFAIYFIGIIIRFWNF